MSEVAPGLSQPSWPSFTAQRFRSDGGFSISGLVILTLITCLTGAIIGLLAGFISQWFFLVLLFPICMGIAIGAVGSLGVKAGKVRMPIVCGTAGFLGGCMAVAAMHGFEYYQFETYLAEIPEPIRILARNFDALQPKLKELDPEVQSIVEELAKNPEDRRALAVHGLLSHIDYKAHKGVEISRAKGGGGKGINLGYTGSYCYWGFELLLIAGCAFAIMKGAAEEPFCTKCDSWKKATPVGDFQGTPANVRDALEYGDLTLLSAHVSNGEGLNASIFCCPQCGTESPIDIRVQKVSVNGKGETSRSNVCTVTYPGEALDHLRQVLVVMPAAEPTASTVVTVDEATAIDDAEQPT